MLDRAVEQIGDGRQVDVRMRAHVHPLTGRQVRRTHLVEEDERPDHRPLPGRQGAVDLEPAQVVGHRQDRLQDQIVLGHAASSFTCSSIASRSSG